MKDILICNNAIEGGGVENILLLLARSLSARGHRVTVAGEACSRAAFYRRYPRSVRYVRRELVRLYGGESAPVWVAAHVLNALYAPFFRLFLRRRFDVAIAMKEGACMRDIARANAKKRFAWIHTDYRYDHWTRMFFSDDGEELDCMRRFDGVVCVSGAAAQSVIDTVGDPGNLIVRYNPIDVSRIRRLADEFIPQDMGPGLRVVAVGRLAQQKNYAMLLRAAKRLADRYDFTLHIIGKGPQRAMLEDMINSMQLTCVRLMGERENPYPYIRKADIFVSSAEWESYGLAIAEAQILGVPVVTVACPAVQEVFDEGCGLLADNDEQALTRALEAMLADAALRRHCREYGAGRFTQEALYAQRIQAICALWEGESDAR